MVHRPADSRLLGNLLSQEKEYAKHLGTLLDHSNASLASVTAYASASSPASAHIILAVAGSLAAADDALRHYAAAVDRWRDYLKGLKALEDEVGNIMRDREILVTRLIKASKPALHTSPSSSSLPLSPGQSHSSISLPSNAKLVAAQTELQACEAHLATKEAELDTQRAALVRDGLAGRCRALAECGQRWAEAGRSGAVSAVGGNASGTSSPPRASIAGDPNKPLPGVSGSDVSLAPSQSASQINLFADQQQHIYSDAPLPPSSSSDHHGMSLPAPHAIADLAVPFAQRRVLARRITEEDLLRMPPEDEDGGSSIAEGDGDAGELKVVENPRFASASTVKPNAKSAAAKSGGTGTSNGILKRREPTEALRRESTYGSSTLSVPTKSTSGFFGSLRGLFGKKGGSDAGGRSKRKKGLGRGRKADADSDADEDEDLEEVRSEPLVLRTRGRVVSDVGSQRRRGMGFGGDADASARRATTEEWVGGLPPLPRSAQRESEDNERGWASDTPIGSVNANAKLKRRKSKGKGKAAGIGIGAPSGIAAPVGSRASTVRSVSSASDSTAEVVLSTRQKRRSSLGVSGGDGGAADALVPPPPPVAVPSTSSSNAKPPAPKTPSAQTTRVERRASLPVHSPAMRAAQRDREGMSLMSIVEGVARANRDGWKLYNGVPTAPTDNTNGTRPGLGLDTSFERGRTVSAGPSSAPPTQMPVDGLPVVRAPASVFSTPAVPSGFAGPPGSGSGSGSGTSSAASSDVRRPAKSPLRSALRVPSPPPPPPAVSPLPPAALPAPAPVAHEVVVPLIKPAAVPVPIPVPAPVLNGIGAGVGRVKDKGKWKAAVRDDTVEEEEGRSEDDTASIASYATALGSENSDSSSGDGESGGDETEHEDHPPPVPPHEYPHLNGRVLHDSPIESSKNTDNMLIEDFGKGSDVSTSSASTTQQPRSQPPQRRKSVRVSLQPTFSTTPPASPADEEEDAALWGGNNRGGIVNNGAPDLWEDSSEEDVEYQKAKKLLNRLAKKEGKSKNIKSR